MTRFSLRYPYAIAGLALLIFGLGIYAYYDTPIDLFPASNPPQVTVVTVLPSASSSDVNDRVTEVLENELYIIEGVQSVRSTSRDEVSSITVEFSYRRTLQETLVDVQNAIARVRADLPDRVMDPRVFQLTEYTSRPLLTLALQPKNPNEHSLSDVRLLAENQVKNELLRLDGVSDVDVFGGNEPQIRIRLQRDRLAAFDLAPSDVVTVLSRRNISSPAGNIYDGNDEYLVQVSGEFSSLDEIRSLPVTRPGKGEVRVEDIATVQREPEDPHSLYHGNGDPAIALGIIRPYDGRTVDTIETVKAHLPELRAQFPGLRMEITQDQQPLIDLNMNGMINSVIQAIILTVFVIFLFLGDYRAAVVVSISIPLSFLFTLIVLWLSPFTLNMITLTGIIVAIGMVVDGAVVALENIYRHYRESDSRDASRAALEGTREITLAITAGMLTTVVVLVPIMFMGGYPQRTIGRLSFTIATTLVISLFLSITIIPILSAKLLNVGSLSRRYLEKMADYVDVGIDGLESIYKDLLKLALNWRVTSLLIMIALLVLTVRLVPPKIGGELMPPMDTGITNVKFTVPATYSLAEVESTLNDVERIINNDDGVKRMSSVVGSEPGAISFGTGGSTTQSARLTVYLVNRKQREESIWSLQSDWRRKINQLPDIQSVQVSEFGATPMASTRAPLDVRISGPDPELLDRYANRVINELKGVPGLVDVRRNWYYDEREYDVSVDPSLARFYGTSTDRVARNLRASVDGARAGNMRLEQFLDIPIYVDYQSSDLNGPEDVEDIYVESKYGPLPLRTLADVQSRRTRPLISREELQNTINVTGVNRTYTISQVHSMVQDRLSSMDLPSGYTLDVGGTASDMQATQVRLMRALLIGVIFLFVLLFMMFQSLTDPLVVMSIIPFTVGAALWGLLLFDKPLCMPANMGLIFVAGVVVNNSVLMLDFINRGKEQGLDEHDAIMKSLHVRIRPILMTTASTVVGLSPLVLELAVGLERLSPLAIVASSGLLVGTFLTMIVVPIVYSLFSSGKRIIRQGIAALRE